MNRGNNISGLSEVWEHTATNNVPVKSQIAYPPKAWVQQCYHTGVNTYQVPLWVPANLKTVGSSYLGINAPYIPTQSSNHLSVNISTVWGQSTQIPSSLRPKRDCGPKRVKGRSNRTAFPLPGLFRISTFFALHFFSCSRFSFSFLIFQVLNCYVSVPDISPSATYPRLWQKAALRILIQISQIWKIWKTCLSIRQAL